MRIGLGVSLGLLLLHAVLLLSGFEVLACSGRTGASLNSRGFILYGARGVYRLFLYDVAVTPTGGYA